MALALELGLDGDADGAVRGLWSQLETDGVPSLASYLDGIRPHVSLVVSDDHDGLRGCAHELRPLLEQLPVSLTSPGVFPGQMPVLFLAVTPSEPLLRMHGRVGRLLTDRGVDVWPHYRPDVWLPHCTLSMGVPPAQLGAAIERCLGRPLPIAARLAGPKLTDSATGATAPL